MSDPQKSHWYKDGLCFSCTLCGNCCSGGPGYVWVNTDEISQIAKYLETRGIKSLSLYLRRVGSKYSLTETSDGDCIFLERRSGKAFCQIHPIKPSQCRSWPFWNSILESKEAWDETKQSCPGMDQGKKYSLAEIQKLKDSNV